MDSNSTLVPNQHSSSWKRERCSVETDHFAMDTYNHNHSEADHRIAYPAFPRPRLRIDSRIAVLPEHEKEQRPVSSSLQEWDLFHDSLVVSGAKPRQLNPWAAVGSVTLLSLLLLALVVIPLFDTDTLTLPKRETLTLLYVPPAAAASNVTRLPVARSTPINTPTNMRIPSPVHTTQEAPPAPPVDPAGGLVGGVPGGVVGGIPGGVLNQVLHSTGSTPVLATTPAPKRIRVPARTAEANLVYDVTPKYPPEAGRARIEGTVVLLAVIGKDGAVEDVRVEKGLPVLAQAAIEAVKQWRYRPYFLNGEPVEVDSQITINFTLSRG
jgi:periplasmic protein TonB